MKDMNKASREAGRPNRRSYERPRIETYESTDLVKILGAAQALSSAGGGDGGTDSLVQPVYRGRGGHLGRH